MYIYTYIIIYTLLQFRLPNLADKNNELNNFIFSCDSSVRRRYWL